MNKDIYQGKWNEYKGKIKEKWGKLTDNDITEINRKEKPYLAKFKHVMAMPKREPKKN